MIPLRTRAELALHAVNGLAYLHEMNVVHFDLKPDNLLLDGPLLLAPGYAVPALKVADFGLSKHKWNSYVSGVRDLRWVQTHNIIKFDLHQHVPGPGYPH